MSSVKTINQGGVAMKKDNTKIWDKNHGRIFATGGIVPGKGIFCCGYDMMKDLVGKVPFSQVIILNVTGRMVEKKVAQWLDAYFICNSYPDARIWCNQIGSLAGTMQVDPVAGVVFGILASDSHLYGPGTVKESAEFIIAALLKKKEGFSARQIVELNQRNNKAKPQIIGFASRPIFVGDERIEAMEKFSKELGFERGEHLSLVFEIEEIMIEKTGEGMNALPYVTGFLVDQGFNPKEIYNICATLVFSGVQACYVNAKLNYPGVFFPLQCEDIDYQGVGMRTLKNGK